MAGVDVRHLLQTHGLMARKALGQCFLHDTGVLTRIADAVAGPDSAEVIEIGAGLGALTATLAERGHRVHAIEKDARLIPLLEDIFRDTPAVRIVRGDATELDLASLATGARPFVAGNLPYSVSSPLLLALLAQRDRLGPATVMLQREFAQRLAASPRSKDYGSLTALFGLLADVHHVLDVGPGAFSPPPTVHSSVIRVVWLDAPRFSVPSVAYFERVTRAAFSQRRKTLRNALQTAFARDLVREAGEAAGLDLDRRAETLSVEELAGLARTFSAREEAHRAR
jgi:16S rRNA (adenine1518-N6/adenine1519-N6)-dimethyltransferase